MADGIAAEVPAPSSMGQLSPPPPPTPPLLPTPFPSPMPDVGEVDRALLFGWAAVPLLGPLYPRREATKTHSESVARHRPQGFCPSHFRCFPRYTERHSMPISRDPQKGQSIESETKWAINQSGQVARGETGWKHGQTRRQDRRSVWGWMDGIERAEDGGPAFAMFARSLQDGEGLMD